MNCKDCKWWQEWTLKTKGKGDCRKKAPVVAVFEEGACWPVSNVSDWCGEFEPKKS